MRETEGSDNATINPKSRQVELVFLLVSSNKINNIHTNTNDIYFYVLLLRLIGLLFDTEVASEAKQELFYSKYMPFILNLF